MRYAGGVDVGSTQTKAVIIDERRRIVGRALIDTGAHVVMAAGAAFDCALGQAQLERGTVDYVIGTGYGRYKVEFGDAQVTEIACHARGAAEMFPLTRTVLDMGGQDTKAIRLGERGEVLDFCMNDKCAAGTGRFLQSAAAALELALSRSARRARCSPSRRCCRGWRGDGAWRTSCSACIARSRSAHSGCSAVSGSRKRSRSRAA
jgi:predicted CoA-substrate-specific enzyme activase